MQEDGVGGRNHRVAQVGSRPPSGRRMGLENKCLSLLPPPGATLLVCRDWSFRPDLREKG